MNPQIFSYIRRKKMTDILIVNRLFVSAYVSMNSFVVNNSSLINHYLIQLSDLDYPLFQEFIGQIKKFHGSVLSLEDLVELFEYVISPADRIVTGAIYTPFFIRKTIISTCLDKYNNELLNSIRIADVACGCGAFLMDVALYIYDRIQKPFLNIFKENIYGIDIQEYSIERTQILLSLLALSKQEDFDFDFNLLTADTLDYVCKGWEKTGFNKFDVIVGNPPYVCSRNVNKETKCKMQKYIVCNSGHPDLYIPFFQIAIDMLKENGMMGYITMNSFIRSVNGRSIRKYFSENRYDIRIIDFRGYQIFRKKSTYTCLFYLSKREKSDVIRYVADENRILTLDPTYDVIPYNKLDNYKGWNLNKFAEATRLEEGVSIGKFCPSRHGIATLSNKTYIFIPSKKDEMYYYIKKNGINYPIEKAICRDIVNSNRLNSDVKFENIIEKVIYPYYQNESGKVTIIEEVYFKNNFPKAYLYLCSQRKILAERDKGKNEHYPTWYAYGRTQSLVMPRFKLFFPKFANKKLRCVLCDDDKLLLYNGVAFVNDDVKILRKVQKALESDSFWKYILLNARPYASGYYSLSGVDIKQFGICK